MLLWVNVAFMANRTKELFWMCEVYILTEGRIRGLSNRIYLDQNIRMLPTWLHLVPLIIAHFFFTRKCFFLIKKET